MSDAKQRRPTMPNTSGTRTNTNSKSSSSQVGSLRKLLGDFNQFTPNASQHKELEIRLHLKPQVDRDIIQNIYRSLQKKGEVFRYNEFSVDALYSSGLTKQVIYSDSSTPATRYRQKSHHVPHFITKDVHRFKVDFSVEDIKSDKEVDTKQLGSPSMFRIKARYSLLPEGSDWRYDFTLVREFESRQTTKSGLKNSKDKLFSSDDLLTHEHLFSADRVEIEAELISESPVNDDMVREQVELLNSFMDANYVDRKEYQELIYEIAKYVVPHSVLDKFKSEYGLKKLSNQSIELTREDFVNKVTPNATDFYVTDKADGTRCLVYMEGTKVYVLADSLYEKTRNYSNTKITIVDAELCEINGTPTLLGFDVLVFRGTNVSWKPFRERLKLWPKLDEDLDGVGFMKRFESLSPSVQDAIKTMYTRSDRTYEVDGLIFTRADLSYNRLVSYKWKPFEHMTVDFIVMRSMVNKRYYYLYCGINEIHRKKINIDIANLKEYKTLFPNYAQLWKSGYYPIQFSPSDKPKDAFVVSTSISQTDLHGKVCEFRLDQQRNWEFVRVREDRLNEVNRGSYFGNDFRVAESLWHSSSHPLTFEEMTTEVNLSYFKSDLSEYKAQRGFNSFVKQKVLRSYEGPKNWVVDLAAGKGQDLKRIVDLGFQNALFIDKDVSALQELNRRKLNLPQHDTSIYTLKLDLDESYRKISSVISSLIENLEGKVDLVSCQFALHYFTGSISQLRNILNLVKYLLRPGGVAMFTCFDGEKVFDLLKGNNGEWNLGEENYRVKYSIKQLFRSNTITPAGQPIGVLLPFSNGEYYNEYLVNFSSLNANARKLSLENARSGSFSDMLSGYTNRKFPLSEVDKEYVSLYSYLVFTKQATRAIAKTPKDKIISAFSELVGNKKLEIRNVEDKSNNMYGNIAKSKGIDMANPVDCVEPEPDAIEKINYEFGLNENYIWNLSAEERTSEDPAFKFDEGTTTRIYKLDLSNLNKEYVAKLQILLDSFESCYLYRPTQCVYFVCMRFRSINENIFSKRFAYKNLCADLILKLVLISY